MCGSDLRAHARRKTGRSAPAHNKCDEALHADTENQVVVTSVHPFATRVPRLWIRFGIRLEDVALMTPTLLEQSIGALITFAAVLLVLAGASQLRRAHCPPELTRKAAHITTCIVVLPLPVLGPGSMWILCRARGGFRIGAFGSDSVRSCTRRLAVDRRMMSPETIRARYAPAWRRSGYSKRRLRWRQYGAVPHPDAGTSEFSPDALAALVGKRWGRHRYAAGAWAPVWAWEGTAVFALSACLVFTATGGKPSTRAFR